MNRLLVDGSTTDELFIKEPIIKQTEKKQWYDFKRNKMPAINGDKPN